MAKSLPTLWDEVKMPDAANGSNSRAFDVPVGAVSATFFIPDLTGAGTCKLQALQPKRADVDADAWGDAIAVIYAAGASIGTMNLAGFADSTVYVVPIAGLSGATLRFVSTVAQGAAVDAFSIFVAWGMTR